MFSRFFPRKPTAPKAARASALGTGAGRDLFAVESMEPRILLSAAPIDAPQAVSDVSALPDTRTDLDQSVQHAPATTTEIVVPVIEDTSHLFGDTSDLPEANLNTPDNLSETEIEVVPTAPATLSPTSESTSFETHQDEQITAPADPVIDTMTDELVTTLHAANGPPADAETTTPDVNNFDLTLTSAPLSAEVDSIQAPASEGKLLSSPGDDPVSEVSENSQTGAPLSASPEATQVASAAAPAESNGPDGPQNATTGPVEFGPISFQLSTDADRSDLENFLNGSSPDFSISVSGWIRVSDFVYISGTFTLTKKATQNLDVRTGLDQSEANLVLGSIPTSETDNNTLARKADGSIIWNLAVETIDIEMSGVDVFVGYTESLEAAAADGNLTAAELEAAGAIGLVLDNVDLGVVLMKALPVDPLTLGVGTLNLAQLKFFALKADADNVELLGVPGLDLGADNLQVRVNQGSFVAGTWGDNVAGLNPPVVDFALSGGYQVGSTVSLSYNGQVLGASADNVLLRISDFVYVSGGFSFNKGGTEAVDVRTGLINPVGNTAITGLKAINTTDTDDGNIGASTNGSMIWNLPIQTVEIGLSDVDVFVGYTNGVAGVLEAAASNGELTKLELEGAGAIGLFLDEADLGMLIGSVVPQIGSLSFLNASLLKFTALQGDADLVELLGVPGLNLSVSKLQVRLNQGSGVGAGWGPLGATPVIDFVQSYPTGTYAVGDTNPLSLGRTDGYRVATNTSGAFKGLYFEDSVVGASADRVLLRISDFVYVSGGFSFNKGGTEAVDVRTGLINPVGNSVISGLKLINTTDTDNGSVGASTNGSMIWNLPIQTVEIGLSDVDVFVGYTDGVAGVLEAAASNGELTKLELEGAGAIGLFLDEADLGMLIGSVVPQIGSLSFLNASLLKFTALQGDADLVELLGVPGLNLSVSKLQVRLNQGSGVGAGWGPLGATPVIDFVQSYPTGTHAEGDTNTLSLGRTDGYRVATNTSGAFKGLYFEDSVVGASADRVLLRISDFVYVSGGFSFNKGGTEAVDVRTGLINPVGNTAITGLKAINTTDTDNGNIGASTNGSMIWNLPIQTVEIGLSDVDVFVGYTNGVAGVLEAAASNGELTKLELEGAGAIGLFLDEADLGMLIGSVVPQIGSLSFLNASLLKFTALQGDADLVELLGVPGLNLSVSKLQVRLNQGSGVGAGWGPLGATPVIDFVQSYPTGTYAVGDTNPLSLGRTDGYRVATNTSGAFKGLYFEDSVVGASADRVLLRISDFVYVSGGFSFNKGGTEAVDVRTGLINPVGNSVISGLKLINTTDTDDGNIGASTNGSMIWNLPIQTVEIGLSDVDVFVGYTNGVAGVLEAAASNGELTKLELEGAGAIGLFLDEVDLGMLIGSVVPQIGSLSFLNASLLKFTALQGDADLVELLGVPGLNLSVSKLQVRLNQGSGVGAGWGPLGATPVIDFVQSYPTGTYAVGDTNTLSLGRTDGYRVATNTSGAFKGLYFEDSVIGASADRVLLRISDFVYVSGGFSFNKGGTEAVDVRTGLINPIGNTVISGLQLINTTDTDDGNVGASTDGSMIWNLPIQTFEIGLSNVDVFVGYTDSSSGVLATAALDGELTKAELEGADAIGLFLDEAEMGMMIGSVVPQIGTLSFLNASLLKFTALQGDADLVELLGVPGLNLSVSKLQVRLNQGSGVGAGWGPLGATPVIDFVQSYPTGTYAVGDPNTFSLGRTDGYRVATNTSGAFKGLYFNDSVVGASADRVLLRISDFVYVSGGFSFNKGGTEAVDVRTGLVNPLGNTVIGGLQLINTTDTDDGNIGASTDGSMIWNLPIQTVEIGLSNVDVFVGYTNASSGVLATAALDGELTKAWDPLESTCRHASLSIL